MQVDYIICNNPYESYKMIYYTWGTQGANTKTIICLHGLNRNARDWDYLATHMANLGYFVISPDIVGRGNSDYLSNPLGYDIEFYAKDIIQLINTLKLTNISIIGTSMGGLIAMLLASNQQHKHHIQKMILNDVGAKIDSAGIHEIMNLSDNDIKCKSFNEALKVLQHGIGNSFGILPDHIWHHMTLHSFQKNTYGDYQLKRDPQINQALSKQKDFDLSRDVELWHYWESIKIPTLIIRGANSQFLSVDTINTMQQINELTSYVTIKGAAHAPFLHTTEHCTIINNFLQ